MWGAIAYDASPGRKPVVLRRLLPYWRAAWMDTTTGVALLFLAAAIELLQPWPLKLLVDYVLGSRPVPLWLANLWPSFRTGNKAGMITGLCGAILVQALAYRFTFLGSQYLLIRVGARMVRQLRVDVCDHLHRLSLTYHDRTRVGDSIYKAAYDTTAALSLTSQALAPAATAVVTFVGILLVVAWLDWYLTLVALLAGPLFLLLIRVFGATIERRSKDYHEKESSLVSILQESLSSIRAVQAFSREPETSSIVTRQADESLAAIKRQVFAQLAFSSSVGLVMAMGITAVVWIGAHRVLAGYLSLGDVILFLAYLGMLYQPMNAFSQSANVVHTARSQLSRVFEVLDTAPEIAERAGAVELPHLAGRIEFRGVSFGYEREAVLKGVDLTVEAGETIAVVGRTGAGKTTLISLLLRFYDPTEGEILIDGRDLRDLKISWLRHQIGVVLQDAILFHATIADNIAYARPGATRAQIEMAAQSALADNFIRSTPQGYDTVLGERGVTLSGGQRQRLAIARAFLKDAPILVLDEPSSALDAETEAALMVAVKQLAKGRTTFIISHRLSTVRHADRVIVLDGGGIVESGTHDELLALGRLYRRLYVSHWGDTTHT